VIPSDVVSKLLHDGGRGHGSDGRFEVSRGVTGRLAQWGVPLASLGDRLGALPMRPAS
jgi:hypothetical protein